MKKLLTATIFVLGLGLMQPAEARDQSHGNHGGHDRIRGHNNNWKNHGGGRNHGHNNHYARPVYVNNYYRPAPYRPYAYQPYYAPVAYNYYDPYPYYGTSVYFRF